MSLGCCQQSEDSPMPSMEFSLGRKDEGRAVLLLFVGGAVHEQLGESEVSLDEERDTASSAEPSRVHTPPGSPAGTVQASPHGVFLSQPASIDEPLLLLDEESVQELAEARRSGKADRAAAEALAVSVEELAA
eukprot:Skav222898  [mRNA]  locus=scaffold1489:14764:18784:+ [translate_table: standard]